MGFFQARVWNGVPLFSEQQLSRVPFGVSLVAQLVKNPPAKQETLVWFLIRKIPWRRGRLPSPVFLPGEAHGQRSLVGYSPWGCGVGHDWATKHHRVKLTRCLQISFLDDIFSIDFKANCQFYFRFLWWQKLNFYCKLHQHLELLKWELTCTLEPREYGFVCFCLFHCLSS